MPSKALDVIQIPSPCSAEWEQMPGDSSRRFCDHCQKFVHNLSAMSTDQAERLVCESAGNLCVRFARDRETGSMITLDYAPTRTSRRRAIVVLASILGSLGVAGAWAADKLLRKPLPPPTFIAGAIAPVPIPANPASPPMNP